MAAPRRPDPPPVGTNPYVPVIVGTALWAVAFLVLLTQHHDMAARGQGWWLWVAFSGVALGLWGLVLMRLHHRGLRASHDRQTRGGGDAPTEHKPPTTSRGG